MDIEAFKRLVRAVPLRPFPWRDDPSPWGVLVSEFMLQQTQTDRVIPYWTRWTRRWPGPADLAAAPLPEVLREWSGLGYNRRAVYLRDAARVITDTRGGRVPDSPGDLETLPGIGPYTAGAIACFAYGRPTVFIETNIRAAVLHCFFPGREGVSDREIFPVLERCLDRERPREWYWALMDYGASLKKRVVNPGRRGAGYHRQAPFAGSFRQVRGKLVRALAAGGPGRPGELRKRAGLEVPEADVYRALEALARESMVAENAGVYRIRE